MQRFAVGQPAAEALPAVQKMLSSPRFRPATIIATDGHAVVLDLSATSPMLRDRSAGIGVVELGELIDAEMHRAGTAFAFGRYAEHRALYDNEHFAAEGGSERRTIHLGVDLFCAAGTAVCAPLDADIALIANNTQELDYGPVLILRHRADQHDFFTLYGHLGLASIGELQAGQPIRAGQQIAEVGAPPENGNWPPHLHFQVIVDLLGLGRDYPGVAFRNQQDFWLALSPSPARFFRDCDAASLDALSGSSR
jgi:hypothetical protein